MPFRIFGFLVVHELRFWFYFDLGGFLDARVGVVFYFYRNLFAGQGIVTMQAKPMANFKREFSVYY